MKKLLARVGDKYFIFVRRKNFIPNQIWGEEIDAHIWRISSLSPAIIGLSMTFNRESQKVLIKCCMCTQTKGINAWMVVMEGFISPLHIHRNFIHECFIETCLHIFVYEYVNTSLIKFIQWFFLFTEELFIHKYFVVMLMVEKCEQDKKNWMDWMLTFCRFQIFFGNVHNLFFWCRL